ncbi:unnamed protein product [Lathyrus oleraceus]
MATTDYSDFSTNSANPYYLHPNENPTLILVSPPLDHKNYHTWARSMNISLISKNKDKFVDGSFPKPSITDPLYSPWIRCNTMVLAWIHQSISDSIARSVLWIDTTAGVWKNLKIRFSQGDIFRISDIQEELYKFRQGNLDISDFFTQLKVLWDELENYRPIPHCKCAIACTCGAIDSIKTYRQQDYVIRFLKGLNDKFSHTKSQIMLMNPLPDIDTVFSMLIQQEREIENFVIDSIVNDAPDMNSSNALLANSYSGNFHGKYNFKGKGQNYSSKGANRFCTHCNRSNHTLETCWIKHGYPISYKGKGKNTSQSTQANSVAPPNGTIHGSSAQLDSNSKPLFGFTQEQYHGILGLVQQFKSQPSPASKSVSTSPLAFNSQSSNGNGKCSHLWILDTGATDHFTFDLSCFSTYRNIIPISVSLPNGT